MNIIVSLWICCVSTTMLLFDFRRCEIYYFYDAFLILLQTDRKMIILIEHSFFITIELKRFKLLLQFHVCITINSDLCSQNCDFVSHSFKLAIEINSQLLTKQVCNLQLWGKSHNGKIKSGRRFAWYKITDFKEKNYVKNTR